MYSRRRGLMLVLSSPSGAGKTTLSRRLLERDAGEVDAADPSIVMSVSVTTRPMRPGEVDGRDYFFISQPRYGQMVQNGELLEHARVFDHFYGTPADFVERHLSQGIDVLFDIDWQGTRQLGRASREDLVSIFILPPSMEELERRLKSRNQDSEEVVNKRMRKASDEISHWQEYDYVLVNDDLDVTLECIDSILDVERLKRTRQLWLEDFVRGLVHNV